MHTRPINELRQEGTMGSKNFESNMSENGKNGEMKNTIKELVSRANNEREAFYFCHLSEALALGRDKSLTKITPIFDFFFF